MNPIDAISAYKNTGGLSGKGGATAAIGGESFADALKSYVGDSIDAMHAGEKATVDGMTGKTDLASVVTAIDNAEVVLNEIVAIRDKAISAYQSITSSAI